MKSIEPRGVDQCGSVSDETTMKLLLLVACFLLEVSNYVCAETVENRIIFDEDFNWLTSEEADHTLNRIKAAGFNVFIPFIWHGRGTSWPSVLAPKEPLWEKKWKPGFDPLDYLIKKAHSMGIEVHPCFTVALRQRDFLTKYYDAGTPVVRWSKSFNIHDPAFRAYISELMLEVVRRYNVDGINLDYVRSNGVCDSSACDKAYKIKTGRDLKVDKKNVSTSSTAAEYIGKWNGQSMDDIVQQFSIHAKALKPNIIISVDTHAGGRSSILLQGADGEKWANKGWVDVIYHMDYADPSKIDIDLYRKAESRLNDKRKLILLVGNYEKKLMFTNSITARTGETVVSLLKKAKSLRQDTRGVALYAYRYLTDSQISIIKKDIFTSSAITHWK